MTGNTLRFLLQGRIRYNDVRKHTLIVTKNEGGKDARNSNRTKLVLQATDVFSTLFHHNKLRPKQASLNARLFLGHPVHRGAFQISKETSMIPASDGVTSVIGINIGLNYELHPTRLWHVSRQFLVQGKYKFRYRPIFSVEERLINNRVAWVKYHLGTVIPLDIGKHMEELLLMYFPGKIQVG